MRSLLCDACRAQQLCPVLVRVATGHVPSVCVAQSLLSLCTTELRAILGNLTEQAPCGHLQAPIAAAAHSSRRESVLETCCALRRVCGLRCAVHSLRWRFLLHVGLALMAALTPASPVLPRCDAPTHTALLRRGLSQYRLLAARSHVAPRGSIPLAGAPARAPQRSR